MALTLYAQNNSVEGQVVDSKTNEPITFVSVYLSETTIGTSTNLTGHYLIKNIPSGKFNLVASVIGYKPKTIDILLRNDEKRIASFSLEPITYKLNQIEVTGNIPSEWYDQFEIFKKYFLGINEFADKCDIKNPFIIDFIETDDTLTAKAAQPIIIQNNALGYKIECTLKCFVYDKKNSVYKYIVLSKFTELTPSTADSLEEYLESRNTAYYGSRTHFLSSLINNVAFRGSGFTVLKNRVLLRNVYEFVEHDSITGNYFLKFNGCIQIKYWNHGTRKSSILCLTYTKMEFDSSGHFSNVNDFWTQGDMAKEGLATMLPRFWKPMEN
jgi:hypothetical protein